MQVLNELVSDVPKLPYLFSQFVLIPLLEIEEVALS